MRLVPGAGLSSNKRAQGPEHRSFVREVESAAVARQRRFGALIEQGLHGLGGIHVLVAPEPAAPLHILRRMPLNRFSRRSRRHAEIEKTPSENSRKSHNDPGFEHP